MSKFHLHLWALELQAMFYLSLKKPSNCLQLAILAEKTSCYLVNLNFFILMG